MRKAASMFIFLVLGTACIIDLEPAETDVVESSVSAGEGPGGADLAGLAGQGAMAVRDQPALRPVEVAPGADRSQACPWCSF